MKKITFLNKVYTNVSLSRYLNEQPNLQNEPYLLILPASDHEIRETYFYPAAAQKFFRNF